VGGGITSLVFVTQLIDETDAAVGFVPGLVRGLGKVFDCVWVIANEVRTVPDDLPGEVISLGKEHGVGRGRRTLTYLRVLTRLTRGRPDALLAHMCPVYLNVAAPIAKPARIPLLLWFAHPADSPTLRLAERLADGVLTSLPGAFPRLSPKVHVVGQAVDLDLFPFSPSAPPGSTLRLLALGRTSPSKGYATMIRAVAKARKQGSLYSLRIAGPSTTREERRHRTYLTELVREEGVDDAVMLGDGVPRAQVPAVIRESDLLVNAMVGGSGDKVVFEALAMGRPVVASNPSFRDLLSGTRLPLAFPEGDSDVLADRLGAIATAGADAWSETVSVLRRRVETDHSLKRWSEQVFRVARSIGSGSDRSVR
jgi:glycosyltransferase involved in cell wall biosynthesis